MNYLFTLLLATALVMAGLLPPLQAQGCYSDPIYDVVVEKEVPYGVAVNYCGTAEELRMDVYRPLGDNNQQRPAMVLIHGGAFVGGDKEGYDMVEAARAFSARGYLAVSINYRLGFHKSVFNTPDAQGCAIIGALAGAQNAQCLYATPQEVERALYRAMQDARGAIRYVKNEIDSVDANNVFIGGSSAGGFVAMAVAYMDDDEAPEAAQVHNQGAAIPLIYSVCHPAGCSPERLGLGPPQGNLNLDAADASVKGVLNIFGALFDLSWIDEEEPMLYSYHKDNDLVVPCHNAQPFRGLVSQCLNNAACTAMPNTWPEAFGSCYLQEYLDTLSNAPVHQFQIEACPLPSFPCNNSCHEVTAAEVQQIVQGVSNFWGCTITQQQQVEIVPQLYAFPNPARNEILLRTGATAPLLEITLYSLNGRAIQHWPMQGELTLDVSSLPSGIYFLMWTDGYDFTFKKIIIHK